MQLVDQHGRPISSDGKADFSYWEIREAFILAARHGDDETLQQLKEAYPKVAENLENHVRNQMRKGIMHEPRASTGGAEEAPAGSPVSGPDPTPAA